MLSKVMWRASRKIIVPRGPRAGVQAVGRANEQWPSGSSARSIPGGIEAVGSGLGADPMEEAGAECGGDAAADRDFADAITVAAT
jgi:hypothetical protein